MNKEQRIKVFKNTIKMVEEMEEELDKDLIERMQSETVLYNDKILIDYDSIKRYDHCEVMVIGNDYLKVIENLKYNGLYPSLAYMSSGTTLGDGVFRGDSGIEEDIFRRTNIYKSLFQFSPIGKVYGIKERKEQYPLDTKFGCIYTPAVMVFRGSEKEGYYYYDIMFLTNVISCPLYNKEQVEADDICDILKNKIRQIFDCAILHHNASIVISANSYCTNDANTTEIAKTIHEVIDEDNYKNAFKLICFAFNDINDNSGVNSNMYNFNVFRKEFSNE